MSDIDKVFMGLSDEIEVHSAEGGSKFRSSRLTITGGDSAKEDFKIVCVGRKEISSQLSIGMFFAPIGASNETCFLSIGGGLNDISERLVVRIPFSGASKDICLRSIGGDAEYSSHVYAAIFKGSSKENVFRGTGEGLIDISDSTDGEQSFIS